MENSNTLLWVVVSLVILNVGAGAANLWLWRSRTAITATGSGVSAENHATSMALVVCISGPLQRTQVQFRQGQISIGRGEMNTLQLDEPLVSRAHAEVRYADDTSRTDAKGSAHSDYVLEDLGSANGIWMKGRRVMQTRLNFGDQFTIGRNTFALVRVGGAIPQPEKWEDGVSSGVAIASAPQLADYDIDTKIAAGNQVTVYRARRRTSADAGGQNASAKKTSRANTAVVIKFLNNMPYDADERYFRQKFEQQLVIGTTIRHPFCARILGGDAMADPPYLIESYLPNGSLEERLRGAQRMKPNEVVTLVGQICDALAYLHRRGIIHRDISPNNVMFDKEMQACLIDFGIARIAATPTVTSLGLLLGKSRYMSVEQACGDPVTPQSDLYSLGIVAYEMLTGRPPFQGVDTEIIRMHQKERPIAPSEIVRNVDDKLERAILKALEKDPARRHRSAEEMAQAFGYTLPFHDGDVAITDATEVKPGLVRADTMRAMVLQVKDRGAGAAGDATIDYGAGVVVVSESPTLLLREAINPNDKLISRRNGQLYFRDGLWWISELDEAPSLHGIFLNGAHVTEPRVLSFGDEIRIGKTTLLVTDESNP